jgi:hypothetical protein
MQQFFYDGQIRRYLLQAIRLLSNFVVKYGDGRLVRVPVMYGDSDRQVAHILKQNSENKINSTPRIAVYITDLDIDKDRLADATHVGKVHIREREIDNGDYTSSQGHNYTVERLMPTPYKLTLKADIWTSSTEQKLQLLEQILMLFNPSLEIQTTDNYLDWTSLSVVNLGDIVFSSRQIPVGAESNIDIASMTFEIPIWISPPTKVKKLGVITNIIMGIYDGGSTNNGTGYIEGLGVDAAGSQPTIGDLVATQRTTIDNYRIVVYGGQARILDHGENTGADATDLTDVDIDSQEDVSWRQVLDAYPNQYRAGASRIFLIQPDGTEVVGTVAINPLDETVLTVSWDTDTYPSNTDIASTARPNSPGTFDAIVDPEKSAPGSGLAAPITGTRYLIINNIGGGVRETLIADSRSNRIDTSIDFSNVDSVNVFVNGVAVGFNDVNAQGTLSIRLSTPVNIDDIITYEVFLNESGPNAWKNADNSDFIANANDVIEWSGSIWNVVFNAAATTDTITYLTNIYTNVQYKWDGVSWRKSFEGEYPRGTWRLEL